MRLTAPSLIVIFALITGCAQIPASEGGYGWCSGRSCGAWIKTKNGNGGEIISENYDSYGPTVLNLADKDCVRRGMKEAKVSLYRNSGLFGIMRTYQYVCTNTTRFPASAPSTSAPSGRAVPQATYQYQQSAPQVPNATIKSSMDDAKSQCSALGFKRGTKDFGNCVLQIVDK